MFELGMLILAIAALPVVVFICYIIGHLFSLGLEMICAGPIFIIKSFMDYKLKDGNLVDKYSYYTKKDNE